MKSGPARYRSVLGSAGFSCYPPCAENRHGRIGKPGRFLRTQELLSAAKRLGPTAGRGDEDRHAAGRVVKSLNLRLSCCVDLVVSVRPPKPGRMKVMQLKHLNLTTSDVSGLAAFFERFFAFRRALERGSGAFTILNNDEDFVLTLMKAKSHDPVGYPETFHVGFYLDDPAAVHIKHDELAAAGLAPGEIQGGRNMRGTHFYCIAPGNVVIEVATPPKL
jgi:catechol 2,3-dioxygenase-like lactoylglutathione lyase family enzyme